MVERDFMETLHTLSTATSEQDMFCVEPLLIKMCLFLENISIHSSATTFVSIICDSDIYVPVNMTNKADMTKKNI